MSVGTRVKSKSEGDRVGKSIKELGVIQKLKGNTSVFLIIPLFCHSMNAGLGEGSLCPEALVQADTCLACPSQRSYLC